MNPQIVVSDEEFKKWFDRDVDAALAGASSEKSIRETRAAIQKYFPGSVDLELATAKLLETDTIPDAPELSYVDNLRLGRRARSARERGNESLMYALLSATTGEASWRDRAINSALKSAAEIAPFPAADEPPAYGWHPHAHDYQSHDMSHRLNYWMQAWPLLKDSISAEQRKNLMKIVISAARDRLKANRNEIPFNLTLHPLIPAVQVACAFPQLRESAEWLSVLINRIERDFCALPFVTEDGYTREGAIYHCVNTRLLTTAYLSLLHGPGVESHKLRKTLEGAYAVQALLLAPDGSKWALGDSHAVSFHEHWQDAHEALHLGAALFNRPDWKAQAGSVAGADPELLNLWLMGAENIERYASWPKIDLERRVFPNVHAPKSCFHVLKAGKGMNAHAGLLAFGSEFNHAHHDTGQILLYGLGRHLLSDNGHPGYLPTDMNVGFSTKVHGVINIMRRTPLGPRTDFTDHVHDLGTFESDTVSIAMAEHTLFENHVIRRALALVHPHGRDSGEDVFWIVIDRVTWKRGWPEGTNEPNEMIETVFPFHAPGCKAKISEDGQSVWSLYDGPDGAPFKQGGPTRREMRTAHEQSDSDANLQVTCISKPGSAQWDIVLREAGTNAQGGEMVPRPLANFRWRGKLPHAAAYVLVPFRGIQSAPITVHGALDDKMDCLAGVVINGRTIAAAISGFSSGDLHGTIPDAVTFKR